MRRFSTTYTRVDPYTETGGGFPTRFDKQSLSTRELRTGLDAETTLNQKVKLRPSVELVHSFKPSTSEVSGTVIGVTNFSLPATGDSQTWIRSRIDAEYKINESSNVDASLFASTDGNDPSLSAAVSFKLAF